jgi:hypothetical protein
MKTILKSIVFTLFVAVLTTAQAPAGPRRPAAVPADFVITPFGYFHPSCVNHLAKGDVLQIDQNAIQHANGISTAIPVCPYPHYTSDGDAITEDAPTANPLTIGHSHVEYVTTTTTSAYGEMLERFLVPPPPINNDGQTLYFYFGLQDDGSNDVLTVLQPVLGWNADFGSAWGIASWNCCVNGATNESTPLQVNSGDEILGEIENTCGPPPNDKKSCPSWNVYTVDDTIEFLSGGSYGTSLLATSSYGQTFNWAFGAVMEVYNIVQCEDYPASARLSFYELYLYNYKFAQIDNPKWTTTVTSGLSPSCLYGGGPRTQLTLDFYP